jgi:16S rRNA (guanine(966)-N(2))-methyltransferase RsmD
MRIIGGQGKGRRLKSPKGQATRPTGDRVKQTLFDILAPRIPGCRFLDVFAGAGGIGLEALSRGASRVVLVDHDRAAIEAVQANLAALKADGHVQVFRQDARVALAAMGDAGVRFDVVFLDPPYDSPLYEELLELLGGLRLLEADAVVVAEHFHKRALPETIGGLGCSRLVRIGDHKLSFYRPAGGDSR